MKRAKTIFLFAGILLSFLLKAQMPTAGLIAYYPFNDNAIDATGNGNDGVLIGQTNFQPGILGQAANFRGLQVGDWINIPSTNIGTLNQITISSWIRASEWDLNCWLSPEGILTHADANSTDFFGLWAIRNSLDASCGEAASLTDLKFGMGFTSQRQITTTTTYPINEWLHVVGTYDGNTIRVYVNANLAVESPVLPGLQIAVSLPMYINSHFYWGGNSQGRMGGRLDEILLYNRALNICEIQQLYNLGVPYSPIHQDLTICQGENYLGHNTSGTYVDTLVSRNGCDSLVNTNLTVTEPVISISTSANPICSGSSSAMTVTGASNIVWSNGLGTSDVVTVAPLVTTTYSVTGTSSGCSATASVTINVNSPRPPAFTQIGPLCQNSVAPDLPLTSTNTLAITGTWNPGTINTTVPGSTTYTFTPAIGQCAGPGTMTIVITSSLTPLFTQIGPLCQNSVAPDLPLTSTNTPAITGTWNPGTINTTVPGSTTYTFTPAIGQCAGPTTMTIVITNSLTPLFTQIGPLCQNSVAPALPLTSTNTPAITGTWNPGTINTTIPGSTTYTFTPAAGQCAGPATMSVVITNSITPLFTQIGPLCQNSVPPALPLTSTNTPVITGTWNPGTINTTVPGSTTYTFTPEPGQCAASAFMEIIINQTPEADFTYQPEIILMIKSDVSFSGNSTGTSPLDWNWSLGNGDTSNLQTFNYSYSDSGRYLVSLVVSDQFGCVDSVSRYIHILPGCSIVIPNAFTPDGDGYNDSFGPLTKGIASLEMKINDRNGAFVSMIDSVNGRWNGLMPSEKAAPQGIYFYFLNALGIDNLVYIRQGSVALYRDGFNSEDIRLFPNPVRTTAVLDLKGRLAGEKTISIFNTLGIPVWIFNTAEDIINLDLAFLNSGLYIIRASDDIHNIETKFIKE